MNDNLSTSLASGGNQLSINASSSELKLLPSGGWNGLTNKKEKLILLTLIDFLHLLAFQVLNSVSNNNITFELIPILAHYSYETK